MSATLEIARPAAAGAAAGAHATPRAVEQAVAGLAGAMPSLVLAFAGGEPDPGAAAREAARHARGAPVVGMTGSEAIAPTGPLPEGCAAVAFGPEVHVGVGLAPAASADLRAAGRAAAAQALGSVAAAARRTVLLLFLDASSGDQARAIAGAYEVAGPTVAMAGGASAGPVAAHLLDGGAHHDTVVAVALVAPTAAALGIADGCDPLAAPAIATATRGRVLRELDGRPAEEVYLERLGLPGVELDDARLEQLASLHPLGQSGLRGAVRLRHVLGRDPEGLLCASPIPEGSAVEFTRQSADTIVDSAARAARTALDGLTGERPGAVLAFDCGGRRHALGTPAALEREHAALTGALDAPLPPLAGLYTRGEVGRDRGAAGDRNHAIVVVALA